MRSTFVAICIISLGIDWGFVAHEIYGQSAPPQVVDAPLDVFIPAAAVNRARPVLGQVVKKGAEWKYWDRSEDPGPNWNQSEYDDTNWSVGGAPLGYGDRHIKTKVRYGKSSQAKNLVVFFRHQFTLKQKDSKKLPAWLGTVLCDDAAAIYLNGQAVFRRNLPHGKLALETTSSEAVVGKDETTYWPFQIDAKHFRAGQNVLAVRVHQTNRSSGDLGFDLDLLRVTEELAAQMPKRPVEPAAAVKRVAKPPRVAKVQRSFLHLPDGEVHYMGQDGIVKIQRSDAIQQARAQVPLARLVRTMEGDSLVKLAAQHGTDLPVLARLNRTGTKKVFTNPGVACVQWLHQVQRGETLSSLARTYNTQVKTLRVMNPGVLNSDSVQLKAGMRLQVPGEFTYHYRKNGQSYLRLARYAVANVRRTPYDPGSRRTQREKVEQKISVKQFAKAKKMDVDFVCAMNGFAADDFLTKGQSVLIEHSVILNERATLAELAVFFNITMDQLLDVNDFDPDDLEPNQRIQVPIQSRSHLGRSRPSQPQDGVYEVILGDSESAKLTPMTDK